MGRQKRFNEGLRSFVTFRMARAQNRLNAQATALLRQRTALSLTEWRILSIVNLTGSTTASNISREAHMDKGQISRAVKPMIDRGLLAQKTHHQDSRQTILSLTDAGQDIHDRTVGFMRERQTKLVADVSDEDLETFYRVLNSIYENAETPEM